MAVDFFPSIAEKGNKEGHQRRGSTQNQEIKTDRSNIERKKDKKTEREREKKNKKRKEERR